MSGRANGSRDGWWGLGASAEAFMDELVTWRELGVAYNLRHGERHDYEALPEWARRTRDEHAVDRREHLYGLDALEAARTHDPLWNAAQRQLLVEGVIHNYLRMLWGKKVVEWSESPREALRMLIHLNNRWALDGRDPNSLSGIYWCLGRYDRPWAPKREVFGTIRWMSSENTARKFKVKPYLAKHAETGAQAALWN
jgi:deoxyribodipyrimidine photo-lyase